MEVLRISTVVDRRLTGLDKDPLEVLRISTVVDIGAFFCVGHLWKC